MRSGEWGAGMRVKIRELKNKKLAGSVPVDYIFGMVAMRLMLGTVGKDRQFSERKSTLSLSSNTLFLWFSKISVSSRTTSNK